MGPRILFCYIKGGVILKDVTFKTIVFTQWNRINYYAGQMVFLPRILNDKEYGGVMISGKRLDIVCKKKMVHNQICEEL